MAEGLDSDELVEELESLDPADRDQDRETEETGRYFIFSVKDSWYALDPSDVHEIVVDLEIFGLPACPPYVSGLINSHGLPYAVIDLHVLFESERHPAVKFLILNRADDAVAFGCTDVVEICEIPLSAVSAFSGSDQESGFCRSSFFFKEHRVLVISIDAVMGKLAHDLG